MKKYIAVFLVLMLLLSVSLADEQASGLTHEQVKERIGQNLYLNLIDIRTEEVYNASHIPMAMNMPADSLQESLQAILSGGFSYMEAEIILYGDDVQQLESCEKIVKELGFTNVVYMADAAAWPYQMISTEEELAQARRILGGMNARDIYGNAAAEAVIFDYDLTLVNVWATYCNPCLQEMPGLGRLAGEMKDQDVQIIGIVTDVMDYYMNEDAEKIALAQEIVASTGADYLHIVPDAVIARNLLPQITSVPTTFFLDKEGNLVGSVYFGYRDYDGWKAVIEDTLALISGEGDTK